MLTHTKRVHPGLSTSPGSHLHHHKHLFNLTSRGPHRSRAAPPARQSADSRGAQRARTHTLATAAAVSMLDADDHPSSAGSSPGPSPGCTRPLGPNIALLARPGRGPEHAQRGTESAGIGGIADAAPSSAPGADVPAVTSAAAGGPRLPTRRLRIAAMLAEAALIGGRLDTAAGAAAGLQRRLAELACAAREQHARARSGLEQARARLEALEAACAAAAFVSAAPAASRGPTTWRRSQGGTACATAEDEGGEGCWHEPLPGDDHVSDGAAAGGRPAGRPAPRCSVDLWSTASACPSGRATRSSIDSCVLPPPPPSPQLMQSPGGGGAGAGPLLMWFPAHPPA